MSIDKIKLGDNEYLVVDLTQPLPLNAEVYPGDPKPERRLFSDIDKTGWHHYIHVIGDHVFQPHVDGPNHQNPQLKSQGVETFGIDFCFNDAFLMDLSTSSESQTVRSINYLLEVKKKHLKPFVELFSQKSAVLIRTGYDKWLEANNPHQPENLPYLSKEAAEFIASFPNIKVVGIDSLSVDPAKSHVAHQELKRVMIVESLVHLNEIPQEHRLNFSLQTSPIKIIGATGGPVVVYAFIKS
ncbi:MAG: cyclase family protein [Patescibacteria group bacterium]|jgi:kynurenine formamidase